MPPTGFDDRLLERLNRLDPAQVRDYVVRLIEQKQFYLGVFDQLAEGVLVAGPGLRIQFMNRRARQMLGLARGRDYTNQPVLGVLRPDHPLRPALERLAEEPAELEGVEASFGRRGDRVLNLVARLLPGPEASDGAAAQAAPEPERPEPQLLLLMQDITERRRRMEEQSRARRLESLATLTSGIAHEIKNPLNSLNIHAQLLQDEVAEARRIGRAVNPDKADRAVGVMIEETGRLARIIDEFLQAARPRRPQLELTNLRDLLDRADRIFCPECEKQGITLTITSDPEIPPLMLDEHLILQALRNLVRNAVEAVQTREEQARAAGEEFEPWVRISAGLSGDMVMLTVADNGPGVPESALEHIFEPYFTTKFNGTGLGLMVVFRIVSEHRGTLHVDTTPGEGTQFNIALPLQHRPVRLLTQDETHRPAGLLGLEPAKAVGVPKLIVGK